MTLVKTLIRHEGLRLKPYTDSVGKLTIGVGRNLDDVGITQAEAIGLLENDIERVKRELLDNFKWFRHLAQQRKDCLINMVFNLGITRFKRFKKTIAHIENKDWEAAANEMLRSKWAKQVGARAQELADMMRTG